MRFSRTFFSSIIVLLLIPGLTGGGALALQDQGEAMQSVSIHAGTCQDFDASPAYEIGQTSPSVDEVTGALPVEDQESIIGFPGAVPVATANETLGATFGDVFTADPPHSIVVFAGDTPVACGELGGIEDDGRIMVSIQPVDDSRFAGVGVFDEDDAGFLGLGEDEVHVTAYIISLDTSADIDAATPEPVAVEDGAEGFANEDWFVDVAWFQDRVEETIEDPGVLPDVILLGVFPFGEQPEGMIPGTRTLESMALSPLSTSEDDIEEWRFLLITQLLSSTQTIEDDQMDADTTVVIYDDGSFDATALWWALDYLGHENKHMLEGGLGAWSEESEVDTAAMPPGAVGGPVDPDAIPASFGDGLNTDVLATIDDVQVVLEDPDVVLVDVRSPEEYAAGHLPGAVNIPASENVESGDNPVWAGPDHLRQVYADAGVAPDMRVIAYGGDGLGAHVTYFTLGLLGYEDVAVYPGGWVEWSQFPALPRDQGE